MDTSQLGETVESIDVFKDPVLGTVTFIIAIFIPIFVIDGVTGIKLGFNSILITSTIVGILIAFILRRITNEKGK